MFTRKELENLKKDQLKKLAKYYKLEKYKSLRKNELIDALLDHLYPEKPEGELPSASVRIRRIRESNRS